MTRFGKVLREWHVKQSRITTLEDNLNKLQADGHIIFNVVAYSSGYTIISYTSLE
jgi:hypothetical protein